MSMRNLAITLSFLKISKSKYENDQETDIYQMSTIHQRLELVLKVSYFRGNNGPTFEWPYSGIYEVGLPKFH